MSLLVWISSDTQKYENDAHSATPPFPVVGVAPEQYESHDRRARCTVQLATDMLRRESLARETNIQTA